MSPEEILVVVPTVRGREANLDRCLAAYRETAPGARLQVVWGCETCGEAWNVGAGLSEVLHHGAPFQSRAPRYVHFSADDLVPQPGWWETAAAVAGMGALPCPVLLNEDGTVWNEHEPIGSNPGFPRVPFMTWERWQLLGPVPPIHYYSDVWFGRKGIPCVVVGSYRFVHTWAAPGRIHDSEPDRARYMAALEAEGL